MIGKPRTKESARKLAKALNKRFRRQHSTLTHRGLLFFVGRA